MLHCAYKSLRSVLVDEWLKNRAKTVWTQANVDKQSYSDNL